MSSQNFWKFVHVEIPQPGSHNQVDHGGHTEQLRLVDRDLVQQIKENIHQMVFWQSPKLLKLF